MSHDAPAPLRPRRNRTTPPVQDDGILTQLVRARRMGPRAADAVRHDIQRDSRLGIGYLGIGSVIVGLLLVVRGLVSLGWTWAENDYRVLSAAGWVIVIAAFVALVLIARRNRGQLPAWAFTGTLVADSIALALDLASVALNDGAGDYFTVSVGVGATLLACCTFRPIRTIFISVLALAAVTIGFLIVLAIADPVAAATGVAQIVLSVVPALVGVIVVHTFTQLVQRELDRTVAESTIGAPRYGLGLLASSELARLDLAAEELLQDVATGRASLPLDKELASTASGLATDLRRMLVAGRRETWLHHAITESEYLEPVVTLNDHDGLAGYLEPGQRDGLLSAIWMIVDESGRYSPAVDLTIGRTGSLSRPAPADRMVLPIAISVGGLPQRRVDPAVWSALSRVGLYSVEVRTGVLRVSVDAHVVVPDAAR